MYSTLFCCTVRNFLSYRYICIQKLLKSGIHHLSGKSTLFVIKKPEVINELRRLHGDLVLVPADQATNNIVFVCKYYYYGRLLNELGFTSTCGTYKG
jgi:hypothetical protein